MSFCPMLSVAKTEDYGRRPARLDPYVECREKACALWTRYGCGLSHNVTVHAPTDPEEATKP